MECKSCEARKQNLYSGRINYMCLPCCVKLLQSARPNRKAQEGMLAAIAMSRNSPSRKEILHMMKTGIEP